MNTTLSILLMAIGSICAANFYVPIAGFSYKMYTMYL